MVATSCDTFVVLPPLTENGSIIFGKNSDRPSDEIQEIVFYAAKQYPESSTLKCTYIEVEQVRFTNAVILSKPDWMWGAEMGANDKGVCIGNEAVTTKLESKEDAEKKLLGMDLVRLGLERGNTAKEALLIITEMLDKYGQGGPCSESMPDLTYHNSFIICDQQGAYVLETVKDLWAAEHVTEGYRNISNCLSIGNKIDMMSSNLKEKAIELGLWNGDGEFNFTNVFSGLGPNGCSRFENGSLLLQKQTAQAAFNLKSMFEILRDEDSGICMSSGSFVSTSSQVSVLSPTASKRPSVHWFTGTPDPKRSIFKPFVFTENPSIGDLVVSPSQQGPHRLYDLHRKALEKKPAVLETLAALEANCCEELNEFLDQIEKDEVSPSELDTIFRDCVDAESKFYK